MEGYLVIDPGRNVTEMAGLGICAKCGATCQLVYYKDILHTGVNECNARAPHGWRFMRNEHAFELLCGPCAQG